MTIRIVYIVAEGVVWRLAAEGIVEGFCFVRVGVRERAPQGGEIFG